MSAVCELCNEPIFAGHPKGRRTTRVRPYGLPGRLVFHDQCGRTWSALNRDFARLLRESTQPRRPAAVPRCFRALGLTPPCAVQDVRRAYRRLALDRHPDRGGTHEAFLALQKQYEAALRLVGRSGARS